MADSTSTVDGFLIQSDLTKSASVNTAVWQKVLADQNLQVITDDTTLKTLTIDGSDAAVYLRWAPTAGNKELLRYDFSSERNSKYFADEPAFETELKNSARVGDGSHCM